MPKSQRSFYLILILALMFQTMIFSSLTIRQGETIERLKNEYHNHLVSERAVKLIMASCDCYDLRILDEIMSQSYADPVWVAAIIKIESSYNPKATNGNCRGLMQVSDLHGLPVPYDIHANVDFGSRYFATQFARFGNIDGAIEAYNRGPGKVGLKPMSAETVNYIARFKIIVEWAKRGVEGMLL